MIVLENVLILNHIEVKHSYKLFKVNIEDIISLTSLHISCMQIVTEENSYVYAEVIPILLLTTDLRKVVDISSEVHGSVVVEIFSVQVILYQNIVVFNDVNLGQT